MKTISFAYRNIRRYLREPGTIMFSVLSVFIVLALYIFVLGDIQIKNVRDIMGPLGNVDQLIMNWVLGGLVCIPAVSVPLMILCFKVDDLVDMVQDDFFVTPVKRVNLVLGYILAAFGLGFIMTMLTLLLGEFYIIANGGQFMPLGNFIKATLIIALTIFSFSGFSFFIISLLKSKSSLMILNSILNTLIGFLAGLFVPLGMLSKSISSAVKIFPLAQAASLLRQIFMEDAINSVFRSGPVEQLTYFKEQYGIELTIGDQLLTSSEIIPVLAMFGIVFYIASVIVISRSKK